MQPRYPLPLHHSWPLYERARHFDLGWSERTSVRVPGRAGADTPEDAEAIARLGVGVWH